MQIMKNFKTECRDFPHSVDFQFLTSLNFRPAIFTMLSFGLFDTKDKRVDRLTAGLDIRLHAELIFDVTSDLGCFFLAGVFARKNRHDL